jgi:MYXO-CTERM domain-containing protein
MALATLVLIAAVPAEAQVRPKVLIIFDTSGSMLKNSAEVWQDGDGSALCTNKGQTSRIYLLKAALFEVLQGIGAKEIDFGLATYPMSVDPTRTPYCAVGGGYCSTAGDCRPGETCEGPFYTVPCDSSPCPVNQPCVNVPGNGKWCVGKMCMSPCQTMNPAQPTCSGHYFQTNGTLAEGNGCSWAPNPCFGCKVSTHTPQTQQNANCGDASNPCGAWYTQMRGTATAAGEVLKVPFGSAPENVMIYFDQQEDADKVAPLDNPEVRAGDGWWTPIGKSLFYAHGYFHKDVIPSVPAYEKTCTKLVVAFFTDGEETCNAQYGAADPFYPNKWAGALKNLGITTHMVAVDVPSGNPNQCTSTLTSIAQAGGGVCYPVVSSTAGLKAAFLDILAKAQPPGELCNGADDDCDGKVDEDFPQKGQPCNNGKLGVCFKTGVYVCSADGKGVTCNAPSPSGTPEICDGLDNDCNGVVDDVPGGCTKLCQPEICNGLDDDCDGKIDNGIPSVPCGKDVGECKAGVSKCVAGKIVCEGGTAPTAEKCDNLDNDCDGVTDGMGEPCYSGATGCSFQSGKWVCKGVCTPGVRVCTAGVWGKCQGEVLPSKEICDGIDNNCDGNVDEQAECPDGGKCENGQCALKCGGVEFGCPKGYTCIGGWCIKDPCDFIACEAKGWVCKAGECIDPCKNVQCKNTEICVKGACEDQTCYNPKRACPTGESCVQGVCVKAPCSGVQCKADEFCLNDKCLKLCDSLACPPGESCKLVTQGGETKTICVKDACLGVTCATGLGEVCIGGKCVKDPCAGVPCNRGEVCVEGKCVTDQCENMKCPTGYRCERNACVAANVASTTDLLASGAGGCACSQASSDPLGSLALALALVGLALIARRRHHDR